MKVLIVIIGLIAAALTWLVIFIVMDVIEYVLQELNHEIRNLKGEWKHAIWDLEWALKH